MASTLIKRICDAGQLTQSEADAIVAEKGYVAKWQLKLSLHAVTAVANEIRVGRLPLAAMSQWLTAAEMVDAETLISALAPEDGIGGVSEVWGLFILGEEGIYTVEQIEAILGL